jgi:hypothetical protein
MVSPSTTSARCWIVSLVLLTAAASVHAQAVDGTYTGSLTCEAIPGVTAAPLKTLFTLRIAGNKIGYEREVIRPTGEAPLGITERGIGRLDADGELTLTGSARGRTFSSEATYKGKPTGDTIRLAGTQIWTYIDKPTPHSRPCTVDLTRAK